MRRLAVAAIFFSALAVLWQLMVASGRWSPVLLPSPLSVG
jgi:NitT/TauT family transport system permease protein